MPDFRFFVSYVCLVVVSLFISHAAFSAVVVGTVENVGGTVIRSNTSMGLNEKLVLESDIYESDEINTGAASFVKISMKDQSIHNLGPTSQLLIEKFKYENSEHPTSIYFLVIGQLRSIFQKRSEGTPITIKTKSVSMGIRGTEPIVEVINLKERNRNGDKQITRLAVLSGVVEMDIGGQIKKIAQGEMLVSDSMIVEKISRRALASLNTNNQSFTNDVIAVRGAIFKNEKIEQFIAQTSPKAPRNDAPPAALGRKANPADVAAGDVRPIKPAPTRQPIIALPPQPPIVPRPPIITPPILATPTPRPPDFSVLLCTFQ